MSNSDLKERREEIENLVVKVKEGEHEAFSKLYDIFIDPIYRYVYYRVRSGDAEDLVETLFLKIWQNIRKYKTGKNRHFSAWIFRIAHNLVVDYYRSSKDRKFEELVMDVPDERREHNPIRRAEKGFDDEALKSAMKGLKRSYQEIIIYKFINELSNSEIAEILNKSEGSVRILQFRALKALRNQFDDMGLKYDV